MGTSHSSVQRKRRMEEKLISLRHSGETWKLKMLGRKVIDDA
jgi:hypothetical protein